MKKSFKISLVLFLFVSISLVGVLSLNVVAVDDMNFEFDQNILYDSSSPDYSNEFNMRNKTRPSGEFNSSYSFTEDAIGLSKTDIPFIHYVHSSLEKLEVIGESGIHKKVLELDSSIAYTYGYNAFSEIDGTVELWFNWISGANNVMLSDDGDAMIYVRIHETSIKLYHGSSHFDVPTNGFTHLKMEFDCVVDTFSLWVNGLLEIDDLDFYQNRVCDSFNRFQIGVDVSGGSCIFDAIDCSWMPGYIEGRNRFSFTDFDVSIQEVNRYEWGLCAPNDRVAPGSSDVNGWIDYEVDAGYSEVIDDSTENGDSVYKIWGYGDDAGIYKESFTETSERINVTIGANINQYATNGNSVNISVYSSDSTEVCDLSFVKVGGVYEMNFLSNGTYIKDFGVSFFDEYIDYNIYLDYFFNLIILRFRIISSGNCYSYEFELESDKQGLSKIDAIVYADPGDNVIYMLVDYIGIYSDCVPISGGAYGFLEYPLGDSWNMLTQNLLFIDSEGISKMYYYSNTGSRVNYVPEDCNIMAIDSFVPHSGERFFNMYDDYNYSYVENPSLIFFVNLLFDFNSLYIYGIELNEGNNTYPLEMFYAGVDLDESYFYLNDDDILRFILTTNYEYPEYIHANFDINDVSTDDMSISFSSQITSGGFGDFQVSYTIGTSNFINFFDVHSTINIALPSDTEIARLGIYVYDDDKYNNSVCTGYVYNLELINYADLPSDVDTSELLNVIISLIIIFFPTMIFYKRFGKKAIPPIFLLMLIICTITSLIPVWLFFVVIFAFAGLIIFDRKKGSDN